MYHWVRGRAPHQAGHEQQPRFDVNPNTGSPLGREQSYRTVRQTIYHSAEMPSRVVLSVQS